MRWQKMYTASRSKFSIIEIEDDRLLDRAVTVYREVQQLVGIPSALRRSSRQHIAHFRIADAPAHHVGGADQADTLQHIPAGFSFV